MNEQFSEINCSSCNLMFQQQTMQTLAVPQLSACGICSSASKQARAALDRSLKAPDHPHLVSSSCAACLPVVYSWQP